MRRCKSMTDAIGEGNRVNIKIKIYKNRKIEKEYRPRHGV
jgi:hypothetical protein